MLKIIIPLAGSSDLFINTGYFYPKPLIEINGITMIEWVLQNPSKITIETQIIFIIKEEDASKFHLDNTLKLLSPFCEIVKIKKDTQGALCSILLAIDKIDPKDNLLILNGDQVLNCDFNKILDYWKNTEIDAGLVTFKAIHPRWSYARIENEYVVQTAEKNPISRNAIAGYYYFASAETFFECAQEVIYNNVQLNGKYFISPVINQYVLKNKKIKAYEISFADYHSFYSPQMVSEFEKKTLNLQF